MRERLEETESASLAVVMAVAERSNRQPEDLRPLHDVIDTEALDTLFRSDVGIVRFPYEGYTVTVSSDQTVSIEEQSTETADN